MGFGIASYLDPLPIYIHDYLVNGEIDSHRYWMHKRGKIRKDELSKTLESIIQNHLNKRGTLNEESFMSPRKRVRSVKNHKLSHRDSNGDLK